MARPALAASLEAVLGDRGNANRVFEILELLAVRGAAGARGGGERGAGRPRRHSRPRSSPGQGGGGRAVCRTDVPPAVRRQSACRGGRAAR